MTQITDTLGQPVETNAPNRAGGCIQVVLAYPELIEDYERHLAPRGLVLAPVPGDDSGIPTYIVAPTVETWQRAQHAKVGQ